MANHTHPAAQQAMAEEMAAATKRLPTKKPTPTPTPTPAR